SALDWQVRTAFAAGCAGAFVFAWTDEWHRGGYDIENWKFGLTDRNRQPKPALPVVRRAFTEIPFPAGFLKWPRISVVVCTYNGNRTIRECLEGLSKVEYPNFEVIVVDDGSTEPVAAIAWEYGFRVIRTENRGLSSARNTGIEAASGEIVAYIDDDAYPDPHWLTYLAVTFLKTSHAGVGGPNIAPPGDGDIAECIANAPGGPAHVLLSDVEAEHIPGCNMAFRKAALTAIGGFDPRFRIAGDDVDICWRLQEKGWTLGFNAAAMVWHHRRNSVRMFWKQQLNYGKAEAMLERKWPEKYNGSGHVTWSGRVYGNGTPRALTWLSRIYHGTWGSAPFQSLYQPAPNLLQFLPQIPEWYLVNAAFAVLTAMGFVWAPLLWALPLLCLSAGMPLIQALLYARLARFPGAQSGTARLKFQVLTALLHLLQPMARLKGRLSFGVTPSRRWCLDDLSLPRARTITIWNDRWQPAEKRLQTLEQALRARRAVLSRNGGFDRWDLEVDGGILGAVRTLMAIEEHGGGRQLVRFRTWPSFSMPGIVLILLFALLSMAAALDQLSAVSLILGLGAALLGLFALWDSAVATKLLLSAIEDSADKWKLNEPDIAMSVSTGASCA
ncbi:MAG: glycosyl transferase, partial [Acidobacteria bacterium]